MNRPPVDQSNATASPEPEPGSAHKERTADEIHSALNQIADSFSADLQRLAGETARSVSPPSADATPPLSDVTPASGSDKSAGVAPEGSTHQAGAVSLAEVVGGDAEPDRAGRRRRAHLGAEFVLVACALVLLGIGAAAFLLLRRTAPAEYATGSVGPATTPAAPQPLAPETPTTPPLATRAAPAASIAPAPLSTATIAVAATLTPSLAAAVSTPGRATPTRTAAATREGVILFSSFQTNPGDALIVAVQPDGTGRHALGALPGHPWAPKLSPDGRRLLFSSGAPTRGGRAIDSELNGAGSPDIWIADSDGTRARKLVDAAGYNGWCWSPDGRWIAFASNRDGGWSIYKMTAAGEGLVRLTSSPTQDAWPAWTADSAGIIFASTRSDQAQLYRMDGDGSNLRRFLTSPTADTEPAVAPGGARIAFSAQTAEGGGEIYVVAVDGTGLRRLTASGGLNTAPVWSPDGAKLAFVGQHNGRSDLYVINADGSGLTRLTTEGQNQRPDWGTAATGHEPTLPHWARRPDGTKVTGRAV